MHHDVWSMINDTMRLYAVTLIEYVSDRKLPLCQITPKLWHNMNLMAFYDHVAGEIVMPCLSL